MSTKPHILFHRPTPWESEVNCSTKIFARMFSKAGFRVTYLQSTIHFGHILFRRGYYSTWKLGSRFEEGVWVTGGCSLVPYLDKKKILAALTGRLSYLTCVPGIRSLVQASGYGDPDILWTTVPGSTALKQVFPDAKLVFHVIDNYAAYQGPGAAFLEKRDYRDADLIFVIGAALREYLLDRYNVPEVKITNLGQGVDLDRFSGAVDPPPDMKEIPHPIAVWVGLGKKIDQPYLRLVAEKMRSKGGSTVLIGPGFEFMQTASSEQDGLYFLGPKPSSRIPAYLRTADIGLMLYNRENQAYYADQHPLKLYEYAAAGLPTVSTPHNEFAALQPPVAVVHSEAELADALDRFLAEPDDATRKMLDFASSHTWDLARKRAQEMLGLLL